MSLRRGRQGDTALSALSELQFWRVLCDEAQFAQDGKKHGQVVRQIAACHRWAVSGTPASPRACVQDVSSLVAFVRGTEWQEQHGWQALVDDLLAAAPPEPEGAEGAEQAEGALPDGMLVDGGAPSASVAAAAVAAAAEEAEAALVRLLRPFFLRRTKAGVGPQLSLPPLTAECVLVPPSTAERCHQSSFVLPAATGFVEGGGSATDGSLLTHLRLSLLSPSLHAAWGRKAKGGGKAAELVVGWSATSWATDSGSR